ncbi:hypothetical protein B0H11DRAFT_361378 [Mycena galericulata]|nr:hypothetical protein B0H11DRAFT_361378 [Mycena galericulata]
MSSRERVPNELWLEVFHYLPRESVKDVSLTDHKFKNISRQLLFAHLDFHPYCIGANSAFLMPVAAEAERSLERLDFWFSDEIVPFVRSCRISLWQKLGPVWGMWDFSATDTPYILLAPFFERLARLTGLRKLHVRGVRFTQTGVANLCRLPALTDVRIERWDVYAAEPIDTNSLKLGVSCFAFRQMVTAEDSVDLWVPLLRPAHLRELEMVCSPSRFAETLDTLPPFPHVYQLTIAMNLSTMSQNLFILSKFPGVQIFSMSGWGELLDGPGPRLQASAILPRLREYSGPYQTLPVFLIKSTLTRLTTGYCMPQDFIAQLQGLRAPENLTSLDATFANLDNAAFDTICAFFTRLTELSVKVAPLVEEDEFENPRATSFFAGLAHAAALPPALERLALIWEFEYEAAETAPPADEIPAFDELHKALLDRCPALTTLCLDGHDFLFCWRKGPDGAEDQAATDDVDEAEVMREDFAAFWETR